MSILQSWQTNAQPWEKQKWIRDAIEASSDMNTLVQDLIRLRPNYDDMAILTEALVQESRLQGKKEIRHVAMVVNSLCNGGIERVVAILTGLLKQQGFRMTLILRKPRTEKDYPVPADTAVHILPGSMNDAPEEKIARYQAMQALLIDEKIDLLIHQIPFEPDTVWDLLAARLAGVRTMWSSHSIFTSSFFNNYDHGYTYLKMFSICAAMADMAICESETNCSYWKLYNPNSFAVPNVMECHMPKEQPEKIRNSFLYMGRLSPEKRVEDMIHILQQVRQQVPDATLLLVGQPETETYGRALHALTEELGLQQAVTFAGYQTDVASWYCKSEVLLLTSQQEGFSLVIGEAKKLGLPTVMYELPIMFCESPKGLITVPQRDISGAAEVLISLFKDRSKLEKLSADALTSAEDYRNDRVAEQMTDLIKRIGAGEVTEVQCRYDRTMMDTYQAEVQRLQERTKELEWQELRLKSDPFYPLQEYTGKWKPVATLTYCLLRWGLKKTIYIFEDKLLHRRPEDDPRLKEEA